MVFIDDAAPLYAKETVPDLASDTEESRFHCPKGPTLSVSTDVSA